MNLNRILFSFTLAAAGVLALAAPSHAQQPAAVAIDNDDIGGHLARAVHRAVAVAVVIRDP